MFSAAVNVLILAGPLYMLQIYDRVLGSRSVPTLVALTIVLFGAYAFIGAFDLIRSRIVVRAAVLLDRHLSTTVHGAVLRIAVQSAKASEAHQPMRDLDQIRAFLVSPGPTAIIDLPWMPAFLVICYLIHPWLGLLVACRSVTPVEPDDPERTRQPCTGARHCQGRRNAVDDAGGRPAQQRDSCRHGHGGGIWRNDGWMLMTDS